MTRRSWPGGLLTRIALVLVCALLVEFAGSYAIDSLNDRRLVTEAETHRIAGQLMAAARVAADTPRQNRARMVSDLAVEGMVLNWVPQTVIADAADRRLARARLDLLEAQPGLAVRDLRLSLLPSAEEGRRDLLGAMQLTDGSFVTFRVRPYTYAPPALLLMLGLHALLMASVLGAALLTVQALVRPLRDLAEAADATGRGPAPQVRLTGPREVQRVAIAFQAMQARLMRMIEEHTQALIAVSHDLRTPVQRLRLRAALLPDDEMREAMTHDLIDIERFIGSVLGFMRDEDEPARLIDVAAIAMTAVDNAADSGASIEYRGPDELIAYAPPLALKRALANLVDNAVANAGEILVTLSVASGSISLAVEDDGPGIPPERREEMRLPFRRMPDAPSATGGAGLGLAIVTKAAEALGGRLILEDSKLGGLAARLQFPARSGPEPA